MFAPLRPGAIDAAPTWRAAHSNRTAALMAAFAQFAYLPFEQLGPEGATALQAALGPDFGPAVLFDRVGTQAYLAVSRDFAVLAFRGTQGAFDWRCNLRAARRPVPGRPEVLVHEGFLSAFEDCRGVVAAALEDAALAGLGLYITGHSLGGALAQIASAAFERDTLAACYTFGSPRVGTSRFDVLVKCPHYRIVNGWDGVPGVPPATPWGYQHGGDARLIDRGTLYRRDRQPWTRAAVDLMALAQAALGRGVLPVADHDIARYRSALEAIAGEAPYPAPVSPPP